MAFFSNLSMRSRLMLIGGSMLAIFIVSTLSIMGQLQLRIDNIQASISQDSKHIIEAEELVVSFKEQVQEWKNTLLRGHTDKDRTKYWQRFQDKQTSIQGSASALLKDIEDNSQSSTVLSQFISSHARIFGTYQQGYKTYMDNDFDYKAADNVVRGIDREPTEKLKAFSDTIKEKLETDQANAKADIRSLARFGLWIVIGLATLMMIVIFVILEKQFNIPIAF